MIKLASPYVTTIEYRYGSDVVGSVTTDTLYIRSVRFDFSTGAFYADIDRGTIVNGIFASNYPSVSIIINPDGSFISNDGKWSGKLQSAAPLVAQMAAQFDQMLVSSGLVQGAIL